MTRDQQLASWDRAVAAFRRHALFSGSAEYHRDYEIAALYLWPGFASPMMVAFGGRL